MKLFSASLLVSVVAAASPLVVGGIKDIVTFGDSVSDNGNIFALYGNPQAPYYKGRFSNGPVWVEYLSQYLSDAQLHDFAYGGSCANVSNSQSIPYGGTGLTTADLPDLAQQLTFFKKSEFSKLSADSTIYTVFAGANDMNYAAAVGKFPDPAAIAGSVVNMIDSLIAFGAKNIVVNNLPPLDKTPRGYSSPNYVAILALLSDQYNQALEAGLARINKESPSTNIIRNNLNKLFTYAVSDEGRKDFGIEVYKTMCYNATAATVCTKQDTYLFWDTIHPTTKGHTAVAQYAYNQIFNLPGYKAPADVVNPKSSTTTSSAAPASKTTSGSAAPSNTAVTTATSTSAAPATSSSEPAAPSCTISVPKDGYYPMPIDYSAWPTALPSATPAAGAPVTPPVYKATNLYSGASGLVASALLGLAGLLMA
ncbi:GDSL-like Lipase/Acylhydrolase-domain-containing protein [Chytriomyces cf. hyalinus JEL632]|nr:GDSL-like Lipase/Acylhydrolase-domain-containing protein [Chytriomyces cf. hyalinus JEL632]